jgi:hypothetical protein
MASIATVALTAIIAGSCSSDSSEAGSPASQPATELGATAPGGSADVTEVAEPTATPAVDVAALPIDARPTTPIGAVEAFLVAQVTGDTATSYALLSEADRAGLSEPDWALAQTELPQHVGFDVTADQELVDGSGVQVAVDAHYLSRLDEIGGLIPARASEVWTVVPDDQAGDEWRIDLARSTTTPVLPPDEDATTAVQTWAQARQDCQPADEYPGLIGAPTLAESLCGAGGEVAVGALASLDTLDDPTPYLNAFGSDVTTWTRVVELDGPAALQVVVAPVDDRWLVIGIAPPSRLG